MLLCCLCAGAQIDDVLRQVERNNLVLRALAREQEAAVLDVKGENALAGPTVEYSPFFKGGYGGVAESELVVSQEFEFPTRYALRNGQARIQQALGEEQYRMCRRETLLQCKLLCLDVIRTNQILGMLEQRLKNGQTIKSMYEKRVKAGDANILEIKRVKLDLMEVEAMVAEARRERTALLGQLRQLNGDVEVELKDTLFPEMPLELSYEEFKAGAVQADASVKRAEMASRLAGQQVRLARSEWLPNVSLGFRRNTEMSEDVNGVLVGLSFPLMGSANKVRAARCRQQGALLQEENARLEAVTRIQSRYEQLMQLRSVLDHSDVRMMQETLSLLTRALQFGEISALQYYTEINGIYEKLQRHMDLHCQSAKLYAELNANSL